jgi:superfamily I DNA/RNA helicase/Zn-dependent peptidase ImmA (M78 family)
MPDWLPLKRLAQQTHLRLVGDSVSETVSLLPAEALLERAQEETEIFATPVSPEDPLLAQAHAVLDREKESIWYSATLTPERRRLILAHEFAHYWLHPEITFDDCNSEETLEAWVHPELGTGAVGYSPLERREREANQFAVELLLPTPLLRELFLKKDWNAAQIAQFVGLPEMVVLYQLLQATLLPLLPEEPKKQEPTVRTPFPLDPSQDRAAKSDQCPLLVEAGPGTGKTRTLTSRLCYLLEEREVAPESILALTFSNRAAQEMRTRLRDAIGLRAERVWIGTFHAFGLELLRKEGRKIGLPLHPHLIETADAILLLERYLDRLNLEAYQYLHNPTFAFPDILRCISRAKDELQTPEMCLALAEAQIARAKTPEAEQSAQKAKEIAHFYRVYQEVLQEQGYLDFGDLIMRSVQLLDAHPDVRARWQAQYPHILADEYQDINRASAQLLRRIAGEGAGFWAVGDVRQAIYRFRGASPANIRQFEEDFPKGRRLRLEVNYRSQELLVGLFSGVATQMATQSEEAEGEVQWEAFRKGENAPAITLAVAEDETAQADHIATLIRRFEAEGISLREQAILCRTNRQADDIAQVLEQYAIPTRHLGGLFERSEIKDMLSLLSLACEPHGSGLARVATFPEYAIPVQDVRLLFQAAKAGSLAFPYALEELGDLPELSEEGRVGVQRLWSHLAPLLSRGGAWQFWTRYLLQESHYLQPLLRSEKFSDTQRLLAIYQLLDYARTAQAKLAQEEGQSLQYAFLGYLRHLLQCGEERSIRPPEEIASLNGVQLMTVHTSKGLEFPVVFVPNLAQGQFPPRRRGNMAQLPTLEEASEEEDGDECLFFVALSRARDRLFLSYPAQRYGEPAKPAPLLQKVTPLLGERGVRPVRWEPLSEKPASPPAPPLPAPPAQKPLYPLSALHQFEDCPRKFYYQRIARLPERTELSPYRHFSESLNQTEQWLKEQRLTGVQPTHEEALAYWDTHWATHDFTTPNPLYALLRAEAERLLQGIVQGLESAEHLRPIPELIAEMDAGRIRLHTDRVEELPNGTLRLVQHKRGRPKDEDHRAPELALLRHAARHHAPDRSIELKLFYPKEGLEREIPEKGKLEFKRLEKYETLLQQMQSETYPPRPDDRKCPACPFFFLCPAD